jgi:glycosyltransferase involved in cell wall biosynthesis
VIKKKIVLFYKNLVDPGGAERLLLNEYIHFTDLGYDVDIVCFNLKKPALFDVPVDPKKIFLLGSSIWPLSMIRFISYVKRNKNVLYLCASGHIEIYIASLFTFIEYSLHIHHPSFMSFNETDKYTLFQKKHFQQMLKSNFGANRFRQIYIDMPFFQKVYINIRGLISIKSIKKAKHIFVLSRYAQKEKKILFNVDSHVICGALNQSIFAHKSKKLFSKYDNYEFRLLTIGRLDVNKRIDDLLVAFKEFLNSNANSVLLIGGKGPEMERLKSLSLDLGINKNVEFLGFIPEEDLLDWYSMADLFISIDWADYRITMYESLAMGTKVLLSNETEADNYLLESNYLNVVKPDAKNTVKALKIMLKLDVLISKNDLDRYLEQFTWSNYCKDIIKVLNN